MFGQNRWLGKRRTRPAEGRRLDGHVDANGRRRPTRMSSGTCSCGGGVGLRWEGQRGQKVTAVRRHLQVSRAWDERHPKVDHVACSPTSELDPLSQSSH
eukprot:213838-Chlamydomonas_euryale.AAC.1